METNTLCNRHIGPDESDVKKMLEKIGVHSLDELINQVIPADIRLKEPIELPEPLTEYAYGKHMAELAAKNKLYAPTSAWGGTTPLRRPLFSAMYLKTPCGTLRIHLIRLRFRKGGSRH
jgi:glycine cleavage system pyridoxal-binding protein P